MPAAATRAARVLPTLLLGLAAAGCGRERAETPRLPAGTPVVLVSIDTLRSDHLPAYGYEGVATPALDALRADSVLFERAYAHVSLTLPSHTSVLTGLLPVANGVRDNLGYRLEAAAVPFLPRLLKKAGYVTGAAVSAYVLRGATGLDADFDFYEDRIEIVPGASLGGLQRPGAATLAAALPWLESARERPFFFFFHLYEPHSPYQPPEPYASRYPIAYDGEIAAADAVVGQLLDRLRSWDLYDRTLLILMSDHGEGLGDHGEQEHEFLLHREALQVPLMIKLPGSERAGSTVAEPAQLADLFSTVAALLGLEAPAEVVGRSLFDALDPEDPIVSENVYSRLHFGWSELASVIAGRFHLIHGPNPELYDLVADPGERRNLASEQRAQAHALRRALEGIDLTVQPPAADPEARAQLEALGYVGTFAAETAGPRPDPKSKLDVVKRLGEARQRYERGDYAGSVAMYERLVAEEPQLIDAWEYYGMALRKVGRLPDALNAYRKALELSGGAPQIALAAAYAYAEAEDWEQARIHAELAVSVHDSAAELLARVALRQDDFATAERWLEQALANRGRRLAPLIVQAELRLMQKRFEEAIALTEQAEQEYGQGSVQDPALIRGLYYVRGKALGELGRGPAAVAAFEREIASNPDYLPAYTHLAFIRAMRGESREAGGALRRMVEANPGPRAYIAAVKTLREMKDPRSASIVLQDALRRWPQDPALRELAGP